MESLLTLPLAGEARVRILQITDTHLFAQKHEALLGVNTWESYQAVLEAIRPHQHEFDLIVATGDLAQDQSSAAYQHFAEGIASFRAPCVWLPGNHDFQPAMYSALQDAGISPAKRVFIGEQWQILLLDSQVFGVPHGELSEFQLEWLERKLADAQNAIRCCCCIIIRYLRVVVGLINTACVTRANWIPCWRSFRTSNTCCAVIFIRSWISTGTVAACWQRRRPVCSLSRTVPTLRWIPSRPAGVLLSYMLMAR